MARVTTDKARDTGANAVRDMQLRHPGGVAVGAVAVAAAIVLLLVYGFPRLFPAIEGSHPDHFVKNVARALANGNDRQALRIARHATRVRRFDPMTYTMYGRLLLAQGEADAGLDQLDKAICLRKDATPPHQETRKPHYFAPARLTLGTYYLERGQIIEALNQFELARPYARLADPQYADFQALLYQAYAQRTLWARALEFGEPSDRELANLETNNLIRLARVCEGLGSWDLLRRAAERLIERDEFLGEAHYLLGRAGFGEKRYDACLDHLKRAVSDEQPGAAFFLGLALENTAQPEAAVQAFLQAPPGDLYRPFAWAKAAILLETSPEARSDAAMGREKLLDEIDREIARMRKMTPIAEYDTYARLRPVAVMVSAQQFVAGGHFPLLILWEDDQPAVQVAQRLALSRYDDTLILQREPGFILQLQGVENLVNWAIVDRLETGAGPVPGWIDTARDWFGLRSDYVAQIQAEETGNAFVGIPKLTWFYSVPARVHDGAGYLLAGRLRGPSGKGGLGWQAIDTDERVQFEDNLPFEDSAGAWIQQAGYARANVYWDALRVQLNVAPRAGTVAFDDVMLVEIREPPSSLLDQPT